MITQVVIRNYRLFRDFIFKPNEGLNIIVGDNESGKSTLLEAINLALTGRVNGKYASESLNPFWFNVEAVKEFWKQRDVTPSGSYPEPPSLLIEVYFAKHASELQRHRGTNNSQRQDSPGFSLRVDIDPDFRAEFEEYARADARPHFIPTEYFRVRWQDFAGTPLGRRPKEVSTAYIDSRTVRSRSAVDFHARQMLVDMLDPHDRAKVSVDYRSSRYNLTAQALESVNQTIRESSTSLGELSLQMDQTASSSWEASVDPHLDNLPFAMSGHGKQVMMKTIIALQTNAAKANCIFIEEPENHLSHTSLHQELGIVSQALSQREPTPQIFITTHSSFVLNRLGLDKLHLLNRGSDTVRFHSKAISADTLSYFQRQSGFDTLRLVLAKHLVLVEGPSDEMVFRRAYEDVMGRTTMEDGIDVVTQGIQGRRGLELCAALNRQVAVLRDNDGADEPDFWQNKVSHFLVAGLRQMFVGYPGDGDTLEPQMINANASNIEAFASAIGFDLSDVPLGDHQVALDRYMRSHKTMWSLKLASSCTSVNYPKYILDAIEFVGRSS